MTTKPPDIFAPEISDVPAGTPLRRRAGDWHHIHDLPCNAYCDMAVARVHAGVTREDGPKSLDDVRRVADPIRDGADGADPPSAGVDRGGPEPFE